jgi:hypothetical protein
MATHVQQPDRLGLTPPAAPREPVTFTDTVGVTWTVREITPSPMPPKLAKVLGEDRRNGGWLLFLSDEGEKRRLAPVPQGWDALSRFEIERWCMRATRVPPAPARRAADRDPAEGNGSGTPTADTTPR